MESYLYVIDGDGDSKLAADLLSKSGVSFKKIFVDKHENGKSMFRDLETTEVPSLATLEAVHVGLKNIKKFIEHMKP